MNENSDNQVQNTPLQKDPEQESQQERQQERQQKNQQEKHQQKMQKLKSVVDANIAAADKTQGIIIVITGNGKGKSTSAFGTAARALGHGQNVGVVQFLKGAFTTGEHLFFSQQAGCEYHAIGDGFTWDTQNRDKDIATAKKAYAQAEKFLRDARVDLVILDEITYMFKYQYLPLEPFLTLLEQRPTMQTVVITGRGAKAELKAIADTVSVIGDEKHAFRAGIKARPGVDW